MKKSLFPLIGILFSVSLALAQTPVEKFIRLSDSLTLGYVEQGSPTGTPVILLHGYTDSRHSYDQVLPHLPRTIHAYALSLRGHGNSSRPKTGYHPDDMADDVIAFMDKAGIRTACMVGHSMGGSVVQSLAVRYPKRVQAFVLISSFVHFNLDGIHELSKLVANLNDPIDPAFGREFQQGTLHRPVPKDFFKTAIAETAKLPAHVWKGALNGQSQSRYIEKLSGVRQPTLILWGDKDSYVPREHQMQFQNAIQGSKLLIYQGTGHALHWEEPERFARDLVQFIETIKPE